MTLAIQKQKNMADKTPKIIACLKRGYSIKSACEIANIGRATLYRWLKEAESEDATDEIVQFSCDFYDARGAGLEKLIKDLDRWENDTETTVVETVEFERDKEGALVLDADGNPIEKLRQRKTTTKKKRHRPSHFERAKFKLISQYPDEWGSRSTPDFDPHDDDSEETSPVDLMEESLGLCMKDERAADDDSV